MKIVRGAAIRIGVLTAVIILTGCVTTKTPRLNDSHAQADAAADNVQLALAYMQEGNLARAKEKLDRAMQEDPTNPNVHSVYGQFYEKINDQKKAGTGLSLSSPQVSGNRVIVGSETGAR